MRSALLVLVFLAGEEPDLARLIGGHLPHPSCSPLTAQPCTSSVTQAPLKVVPEASEPSGACIMHGLCFWIHAAVGSRPAYARVLSRAPHTLTPKFFMGSTAGNVCLTQARLLRQDPKSFTDVAGQQPAGQWAITGHEAEAGAASGAKGIRYNDGVIHMAGDGAPGPLALGVAGARNTASGVCTAGGHVH